MAYDYADADWMSKLTLERPAELEALRDGETARAVAEGLLAGRKH